MCYHKIRREGNGKCSGTGAKPHSAVSSFQNGAARTAQGTAPMAPPLFGAEFIRRRQKRRKKARLSKMPSQPARDKGCGTQRLDTHNAACGIETRTRPWDRNRSLRVSTHTMLRAALKPSSRQPRSLVLIVSTHTMLRAALKHVSRILLILLQPSRHTQCCVRH